MRDLQKAKVLYNELNDTNDILKEDIEFKEIMVNYIYGDIYQHGNLSQQLRELILIVVNTTNHTLTVLSRHVKAAIKMNVPPIQIKEVVYQCTPYIGFGKVEEALEIVNQVLNELHIPLPLESQHTVDEETRFEKGFAVQCAAFGKEHIQSGHAMAPEELKHIQNYLSEHCFGDFYTRNGLDLKIRELMTFVMLSTLGGCENQLRGHIGANITVGNSRELLIETITQCQPYIGFPRTLNALNIINEVTKK